MGIHAFENGNNAFEGHLAQDLHIAGADFHLAGDGQIEEVGGAHAVNGGDESDGNAAADFVNLVEVLHGLDEAENRADDANRGSEAAGGLEDLRNLFFVFGLIVELEFDHFAEFLGFGAIDGQHEGFSEERVIDFL